jgi:hypothetical protein
MARQKLTRTPTESKFAPIWNFIKSNRLFAFFIFVFVVSLICLAIYFQCKANKGRTVESTLWHDFKMIGLYFFGLFSSTLNILISKFNNWIND